MKICVLGEKFQRHTIAFVLAVCDCLCFVCVRLHLLFEREREGGGGVQGWGRLLSKGSLHPPEVLWQAGE